MDSAFDDSISWIAHHCIDMNGNSNYVTSTRNCNLFISTSQLQTREKTYSLFSCILIMSSSLAFLACIKKYWPINHSVQSVHRYTANVKSKCNIERKQTIRPTLLKIACRTLHNFASCVVPWCSGSHFMNEIEDTREVLNEGQYYAEEKKHPHITIPWIAWKQWQKR